MSRVRERRTAMHRPTGAPKATVCTSAGGAATRLRTSGAAPPASTIPQAAALIALDRDTARAVYGRRRGPRSGPARLLLVRQRRARGDRGLHERPDYRALRVGLGVPL